MPNGVYGVRKIAGAIVIGHDDRNARVRPGIFVNLACSSRIAGGADAGHGAVPSPVGLAVAGLRAGTLKRGRLAATSLAASVRKPADQPKCMIMAGRPEMPAQASLSRNPRRNPKPMLRPAQAAAGAAKSG